MPRGSLLRKDGVRAAPAGPPRRSVRAGARRRGYHSRDDAMLGGSQVNGRRGGGIRGEEGVGEFEEGVGSAVEAFVVERAAKGV